MANSNIPGPAGMDVDIAAAHTPGPMGVLDAADPNHKRRRTTLTSPGPLGFNDQADQEQVLTLEEFMDRFCPPGKPSRQESHLLPGFNFYMYENGLIYAQSNDWISKYTAVLKGSINKAYWNLFVRWDSLAGALRPLDNPHMIHAGEPLFYTPKLSEKMGEYIPIRLRREQLQQVVDDELKRIALKRLAKEFELRPKAAEDFMNVMEGIKWSGEVLRIAGTAAAVAGKAGAATVLSAAGGIALIPASILACIKAAQLWEFGLEYVGFEAASYAITAFGYNQRTPPTPDFNYKYAQHWGGQSEATEHEANKAARAWRRGAEDGLAAIERSIEELADRCLQTRDAEKLLLEAGIRKERSINYSPITHQELRRDLIAFYTEVTRQLIQLGGNNNAQQSLLAIYDEFSKQLRESTFSHSTTTREVLVKDREFMVWPCPKEWMKPNRP